MGLTCLKQHRWRGGLIPFTFDVGQNIAQDVKVIIVRTMERWEKVTGGCIHFVPRQAETDYVEITTVPSNSTTSGCVGRRTIETNYVKIGGKKTFTLGGYEVAQPGYPKGTRNIPHELGHIIGFEHEHYRRDSKLMPKAVPPPPKKKFAIESMNVTVARQGWDNVRGAEEMCTHVGMYDMQSIMHYECPCGWQWKAGQQPGVATRPAFGYLNVPGEQEVVDGTWRPSICDIYTVQQLYSG